MNWHLKLSNVQSVSLGNNGGFSPSSYPTRNSGKFVPLPGILPSRVEAENYRRKSTETAGSAILASSLEFLFFCPWQRWPYLPHTSSCFHKGPLVFVLQTLSLTRYIFARKCQGSQRYFPQIPVTLSLSEFSLRVYSFFKCHLILRSVMGLLFLWGAKAVILLWHYYNTSF